MFFRHLFGQKGILVTLNHDLPSSTPRHLHHSSTPRHLHRVTYIATEVRIPHHPDGQNFPWGVLLKAMSSLRATAGLSRTRTSATTITGAPSYNNGRSVCGHEHARYNHVPQPAITRAPPLRAWTQLSCSHGKVTGEHGRKPSPSTKKCTAGRHERAPYNHGTTTRTYERDAPYKCKSPSY